MRATLVAVIVLAASASGQSTAVAETLRELEAGPSVENRGDDWRLVFHIENDSDGINPWNPTDRHYTSGLGLEIAHRAEWAADLADALGFSAGESAAGYFLGQRLFTPRDITDPAPIPDDHPYAAHLFAGVFWQHRRVDVLDHLQVEIGVVGPPALGNEAQDFLHQVFDRRDPRGWRHQLDTEPTFEARYRRSWRFSLLAFDGLGGRWSLEALPRIGVSLGTTEVALEGRQRLRFGVGLPDDFGPGHLLDPADGTGESLTGFSAYVHAGLGARIVAHDLFLAGGTFNDGPSVDGRPLIGELSYGLVMGYRDEGFAVGLSWARFQSTRTFDEQRGRDAWGSVALTIGWRF